MSIVKPQLIARTTDSRDQEPGEPRGWMGHLLGLVNRVASGDTLDRLNLRKPTERVVYTSVRTGFRTVGAATRSFTAVRGRPARLPSAEQRGLFDLTPTDDQKMLQDAVGGFAAEMLRPAAKAADDACAAPADVLAAAAELGVPYLGVAEELGGGGTERSAVSNVLVAEALAHGDMGLALAVLAPAAVSTALSLWGDGDQQATYLPSFVSDDVPVAALAVTEPRAAFDPFLLDTKAVRTAGGFVLTGVKSLVPRAAEAELVVVAAEVDGEGPALFVVESSSRGLAIESSPAMGLRAASMGRVVLEGVTVPSTARLGAADEDLPPAEAYADCIRLARLGWCALAVGTAQAVLDYVIPYVNDRVAFGEPISHRQGVAFPVADIAVEVAGMRLATYRAASRAEQGRTFARETALARRLCTDRGMAIGSDGVQLLGGHGYVKEHPVERWYRDLRAVGVMEGAVLV